MNCEIEDTFSGNINGVTQKLIKSYSGLLL